jgi:hypothetical protein
MAPGYRQVQGWTRPAGAGFFGKPRGRGTIAGLRAELADLPLSLAHEVAKRAAPVVTAAAGTSYDSGRNVYGDARKESVEGAPLSLLRTGTTRRTVRFVNNGRIVRCALGTPYAKYLIGKYGILPCGNAAMPSEWRASLDRIVANVQAGS